MVERRIQGTGGGQYKKHVELPAADALGSVFVYQPGGVANGNVYTDLNLLAADAQMVEGPKIVQVDDSFVAIPLIPGNVVDLNQSMIVGAGGSQQTTLRGQVGSQLVGVYAIAQNLELQNNDPAQALITLSALEYFDVRDGASLASLVAAPVIEWSGQGAVVLRLQEGRLVDLGFGPAFGVTGGAGCSAVLEAYDGSVVDDDTLEVAVGSILSVRLRDFGSDVSTVHALVAGALVLGNIIASSTGVPKYDNQYDSGIITQRWRSTISRMSLAVALLGSGTPSAAFGANSVGEIAGVANAIDAAAVATVEIANPGSPELSATAARGVAQADMAGSLAQVYASGPGSQAEGFAHAPSATTAKIQSTGYGSFAQGYAQALRYNAEIVASGNGAFALGYSKPYDVAAYGPTSLKASGNGAMAQGAAAYYGDVDAQGLGSMARGVAGGGPFVLGAKGRIIASSFSAFASGTAFGADIIADGSGCHAMGVAYYGFAGATSYLKAAGKGSWAGGLANSGIILGGSVPGYNYGSFAFGFVSDPLAGGAGAPAALRAGQLGSVAMGRVQGPNALLEAYNVGSFAVGTAFSQSEYSVAELRTMNDQTGCMAMGFASANNGYTARVASSENGAFAAGRASAGSANAYILATQEGAFAMGDATNGGAITASGEGSLAAGNAAGGSLTSSAYGSIAHGHVLTGRSIVASGDGAIAVGAAQSAVGGADITASADGSMAQGSADTGPITASAVNAVQFGPGVNSVSDSLRIGNAGLHFKGTAGVFGAYANGQFWIANNNIYCYSGGAIQNLTNVP